MTNGIWSLALGVALLASAGCKKTSWDGVVKDCHAYEISAVPFGAESGTMTSSETCETDGVTDVSMFINGHTIDKHTECAKGCLVSVRLGWRNKK
jgi:hypothetical protein